MKNERDGNQDKETIGEKTLSKKDIKELLTNIPDWKIVHEDSMDKLTREYSFDNFSEVLNFTKSIERLSKEEDHHPVLKSTWGKVDIFWWTHSQNGICEQDFQMAAKCDKVYLKLKTKIID